jgi:hypothetical protein
MKRIIQELHNTYRYKKEKIRGINIPFFKRRVLSNTHAGTHTHKQHTHIHDTRTHAREHMSVYVNFMQECSPSAVGNKVGTV